MPLPIFPTELGAPGDGNLIAIYGGSPATTEVIGGVVKMAESVERYLAVGASPPSPTGILGEPLATSGVTVWLRGSLNLDIHGEPTVTDYADMLTRWSAVRAKMLLANYELFLYYHPTAPATFRKYKAMNAVYVRGYWNSPVSFNYLLAAVSTDRVLYQTGPGL